MPSTRPAVIFTFGGLSKKEPLKHVLDDMKAEGMHGIFFVTERELKRNKENIRLVQDYGQDLGIGLTSLQGGTAADYAAQTIHDAYTVESIQDVLNDTAHRYTYPVNAMDLPIEMQPGYGSGEITNKNFQQEFLKRYIGASEVSQDDRMYGFTAREMTLADKTRLVKTAAPQTVFLTFDDWGSDDSINKLLYVLRKHQVHATFFVITKNMVNNPNLLRAIVADGNEVGSHTDHHVPMLTVDEKGHSHPTEDASTYRENVSSSYTKLLHAVGDMKIENGRRRGLTRLLRPPYALDLLLTKNEQRPDGDPKKFKVGLFGDYLTGNYDQRMKTPKDMREKEIDF